VVMGRKKGGQTRADIHDRDKRGTSARRLCKMTAQASRFSRQSQ
jgi:hypothetical protein